jgi:nitrite reductase (NADH) small subunit
VLLDKQEVIRSTMGNKHKICLTDEIKPGERKIVSVEGRSIGIFNVKGDYYALKNSCPHQGADLCAGRVQGVMLPSEPGQYVYGKDGEIVRCPWHGWEFDITTGKSVFDPFKCLVRTYEVEVVDGKELISEEWPSVETFPVAVDGRWIVVTV